MGKVEFTSSIDSSFIPNQCQMFCQNKLCIGEECKEFCNYLLLRVKAPTFCFYVLYYIHHNDINYIVCSVYKLEFKIFIIIEICLFCLQYLDYIHCRQKNAKNVFNKTIQIYVLHCLQNPFQHVSLADLCKKICVQFDRIILQKNEAVLSNSNIEGLTESLLLFCVKIVQALEKTLLLETKVSTA